MKSLALAFLVLTLLHARADLASYVARPDSEAKWSIKGRMVVGNCEVTQLDLVSQVWEGIPWKHDLVLFRPKDAAPTDTVFLLNMGGNAKPEGLTYGAMLASKMKTPVAILHGIPNQPLLNNKREDVLIAETFVRYLKTKDDNWPLLFPMVKSVVKAMDAVQEVSAKDWDRPAKHFIVSGASKRGWATWLTAAADPRVSAIAPMVIDILNMPAQLQRQVECFGHPSEELWPYLERGLIPMPDTNEARQLWSWVDPFTYRSKFTLPKLVVLGTNDRYWATDALNLYWDELPGDKWISYTPNAGHSLVEKKLDGTKEDPMRSVTAIAAFVRHQITGRALPKLSWKHSDAGEKYHLTVAADPMPKSIKVWRANGPSKDLRNAQWTPRVLEAQDGKIDIDEDRPTSGASAFFAELSYEIDGIPYSLCTQIRLIEAPSNPPNQSR